MKCAYSMLIQWSDEDGVYVVSLPEFGGCKTHGSTYEEAAKMGREVIESLLDIYREDGRPLPKALSLDAAPDLGKIMEKLPRKTMNKAKPRRMRKLARSR